MKAGAAAVAAAALAVAVVGVTTVVVVSGAAQASISKSWVTNSEPPLPKLSDTSTESPPLAVPGRERLEVDEAPAGALPAGELP